MRPGALGVHVVGRDGRDAAEVVDAGIEKDARVVDEIGRCLHVHIGGKDRPGQPDRVDEILDRAGRVIAHEGIGLGDEVLDDDLLHVAKALVRRGDRLKGLDAIGSVLADSDEDAGRERDGELPRRVERGEPSLGGLVRGPSVSGEVGSQRLDHHALARSHPAQLREVIAPECASVRVRQESGLVEDELAHGCEVVDGGLVSVLPQPLACDRVALLRELPEREEGLVAARSRPGCRDRDDFLGGEVGGAHP